MVTMLIGGLWHGANWTFIIWGALHGFYLIVAIIAKQTKKYIRDIFTNKYEVNVEKTRLLPLGKDPFFYKIQQTKSSDIKYK